MTIKQAFFILRHGSAEGNHKYLEAVKVIEDEFNRQKAEIERLKEEKDNLIRTYAECQAEAVKEFAERLKEGLSYETTDNTNNPCVTVLYDADEAIDDLVKEFTEGG